MSKKNSVIDELIKQYGAFDGLIDELSSDSEIIEVENDDVFNKNNYQKKVHEEDYTKILAAYAENLGITLKRKRRYKTLVFWLSYVLLIAVSFVFGKMLFSDFENSAKWWSVIGPALASFLTVFIVIPKIITDYLFNAEEEKYMSEIIKNIQSYDKK